MARVCRVFEKGLAVGHNVSHTNTKTKRIWNPNLHKIQVVDEKTGAVTRKKVCTRCLRSGSVRKAL